MEAQAYPINATFVFVYNDYNTYVNDPHLEECFDNAEVHEILDSVKDLFQDTLAFNSEKAFIQWCAKQSMQKKKFMYIQWLNILKDLGAEH